MALDLRLQQKMAQQLVMTPQLQQAIKLLQLSHLEMADVLREEIEQNPVLEDRGEEAHEGDDAPFEPGGTLEEAPADISPVEASAAAQAEADGGDNDAPSHEVAAGSTPEPTGSEVERDVDWESYLDSHSYALPASSGGDELPSYEATLTRGETLIEHLRWQVQMAGWPEQEARIALVLIEAVNDDGYLASDAVTDTAQAFGISTDQVEEVLQRVQEFEPYGVAARDLRECLLLQTRHLSSECTLVVAIIDRHLPHVERRNMGAIMRDTGATQAEIAAAIRTLTSLEPRPGRPFSGREPQYIVPDIYVHKVSGDYHITLNEDGMPRLRISNYYREAMGGAASPTKTYIQEKLRSAAWLIRSIHMRQRTIFKVVESILKFQRDFFDKGVSHLKPLILREVAEDVGMHESTISRVTSNKYVHTPQGIYELKFFFNSSINRVDGDSIASESVRSHIERLIGGENPATPYSDQRIVEILKGRDIDIARRTVAKYRDMLKIPSSSRRKRVY